MRRLLRCAAAMLVFLLGACGDDDARTGPEATAPGTSGPATSVDGEPDDESSEEPVGSPGTATVEEGGFPRDGGDTALLVDVRTGAHARFDRVVLEFEGDVAPSYRVGYLDPPVREDFSGREVDLAGDAFLEIRAAPAAGFDPLSEDARETYTGPRRFAPQDGDVVEEVVRLGDFEGQLAWVVGVERRVPFGVDILEEPLRLVVDLVHDRRHADDPEVHPLTNECTFRESGWDVTARYPSDWVANDDTDTDTGVVPACRVFDAEHAAPPRAHELTAFGFLLHVDPVDFDDIDGPSPDAEVLEREQLTVDGRRAVRYEDRLTQSGVRGPEGARVTTYTIDLGDAVLVARTHEVADLDYDRNRAVLDAVVRQLSLRPAS